MRRHGSNHNGGCCNMMRDVFTPAHKRSLKTQLFASFGMAAFVSLSAVVVSSCCVVYWSGESLIERSQRLMFEQVENRLLSSANLFSVASRNEYCEDSIAIVEEFLKDRVAGYPGMEGWETGAYVPFESETQQRNRNYPLNQPPVPLSHEVPHDFDPETTGDSSVYPRYYPTTIASTKTASYTVHENRQYAAMNNNKEQFHADGLYQATGDLSVMLKSFFEAMVELFTVEIIFFHPNGQTSSLQYPAMKPTNTSEEYYISKGCDWMTQIPNPYTGKPYAAVSPCPPNGTKVPVGFGNRVLEERDELKQILYKTFIDFDGVPTSTNSTTEFPPDNFQQRMRDKVNSNLVSWGGPKLSSADRETPVIIVGKAVFDRVTNELIGVIVLEFPQLILGDDLRRRTLDDDSDVYMIYTNPRDKDDPRNGLIVGTTPGAEQKTFERLEEHKDIKAHFQKTFYDRLEDCATSDSSSNNNNNNNDTQHDHSGNYISTNYFARTQNGGFLVSVPTPPAPKHPCDDPNYRPIAFAVQKIPPNIFRDFTIFAERVRKDVQKNIVLSVLLGIVGLGVILCLLAAMSRILTQPLDWITIVARKVINNDTRTMSPKKKKKKEKATRKVSLSSSSRKFISEDAECAIEPATPTGSKHKDNDEVDLEADLEDGDADGDASSNDENEVGFVNFDYQPESSHTNFCTLSTELQQLLEAFQSMIHGFSGDGVSEVAEPGLCEIKNCVTWHSDFAKLYEGRNNDNDCPKKIRQVSNSTQATTVGSMDNNSASFKGSFHFMVSRRDNSRESVMSQDRPAFCSSDIIMEDDSDGDGDNNCSGSLSPSQIMIQHEWDYHSYGNNMASSASIESSQLICLPGPPPGGPQTIVPAPMKVNCKSTLVPPKLDSKPILPQKDSSFRKLKTACYSKLFWWIVLLMALPILLTNCIIGSIVGSSLVIALPRAWQESARQGSNNIETNALQLITERKAAIMSNQMRGPARDIYLLARITNWLLFGGIQRSETASSMDSTSEECKAYEKGKCQLTTPCSCDWEEGQNETDSQCGYGGDIDSRYLQKLWFEAQKLDSNPITGNRDASPSFPLLLNSPETTSWWRDFTELPGSEVGPSGASGYNTLYDRVSVASATAVSMLPIYNYGTTGLKKPKTVFGGRVAFADDGLVVGWSGCDDWHSYVSNFVSTYDNGASTIDDKLCADGKYGYDPRCQDWYFRGRDHYLLDETPTHVTPPYKLALSDRIAQTITSPITNPRTGEYVGQVALDFRLNYETVLKMLDDENSCSFMITPQEDILGGDMVVSPGSETGWASAKIEDYLFVNETTPTNRDYFTEEILPLIKNGDRGDARFFMTNGDGNEVEMCLYYAPVNIPLVQGLKPDDFTNGETIVSEHVVYSIATGKPCDEIKRPYDGVEEAVQEDMLNRERIFIAIVGAFTIGFILFSVIAATHIAFPMIKLSNIVKNTKKGEYDSIPPLEGGCREVQGVYNTFAKLNKIVKISNTSFFSGKLAMAHHFVADALVLYRKIDDRKAIGVTCNNLANTLFAIQYEHIDEVHCCTPSRPCHVQQALALYNESMSYSQQDFETAEGDLKVEYAIQLADRLFNRGLYFLFIDGYDCAPEDARERGYNDITFSRNLHYDIRENLLEKKQLFSNAASYFNRLVRRINCLAAFYDDVGLREIWDAQLLLDEANQLVSAAIEASSRGKPCPLFQQVNQSGRQQQLEGLEILLAMNTGDRLRAAKTGMQMLVEDSYLLESAFVRAAEALLLVMKDGAADDEEDISFSKRSIECARNDLKVMVKSCKKESLDIGKNCVFVFEILPSQWSEETKDELVDELNHECLELYDNFFRAHDQIGMLAMNMNDTRSVEIGIKEENEGRQRTFLDVATSISATSEDGDARGSLNDSSFPIALQMLLESPLSLQNDSYILWVTDGSTKHNHHTMISLRDQVERWNQEHSYEIHIIVIRLNTTTAAATKRTDDSDPPPAIAIEDDVIVEDMANQSKNSMYLEADSAEELASAFHWASGLLSHNRTTSQFISCLTMEKF